MPLLKKKPFVKAPIPEDIRDDEEVFYCAVTDEIFRDYEDFSERMFLCNSMVWTCSLTGKANLTYAEALESEENARKNFKEFPSELRVPILYLVMRTMKTAFGDMADTIFSYCKDRYFIGEHVEASFHGSKWKNAKVLRVLPPSSPEKTKSPKTPNDDRSFYPLAHSYKYEVEHTNSEDKNISEIMIVDYNSIKRQKGIFSRDKCRLFLKQCVTQNENGIFIVKPSLVEELHLDEVTFDKIFAGPLPKFDASRKIANGKKTRQESIHKYLVKNGDSQKSENNALLLERMKKREEEMKLIKQQQKENEKEAKRKKKQEYNKLLRYFTRWNIPKEDLELEDQQKLPKPTPVKLKVPDEYLGEMFMVLEFVNNFSKNLSAKDFFPGGLTLEIMERALTQNEVAGPLLDLIQMLLVALFNAQDYEASVYKTETENPAYIQHVNIMNVHEATRLATIASKWSKKYQGLPLGQLPLYSLTTSEILRLHLLASGAVINSAGARWRYLQRGGYISEDDPGLYLRLQYPHILKALKTRNVVELPIADKLKILSCLIDQLLTYADYRDIVEERVEKIKQAEINYKITLVAERKREQEFLATKVRLKKMIKMNPSLNDDLRKLEAEAEKKKAENAHKLEQLGKLASDSQILMGQDRAFRKYFKLKSVPGFFVNDEEENRGYCLNKVIEQYPHLVNASRDEILAHLKKTMLDSNSSDKENSPSKNHKKVNGGLNGIREQKFEFIDEMLMCSSDPRKCMVHTSGENREKWCFFHETGSLNKLIGSLNPRGLRESKLQQNLKHDKDEIGKLIIETPYNYLNDSLEIKEEVRRSHRKSNKVKYEDANLGYSNDMSPTEIQHQALIENILEMEEKIFSGYLGRLCVKDREKWRNCLQNKNYKELDITLIKHNGVNDSHTEIPNGVSESQDYYQDNELGLVPDIDNNVLVQNEETQEAIKYLSIALVQVARSVEPKCLRKPLGQVKTGRSDVKKENILELWEQSLLGATSFSQIFLHYSTLDSCILWGKAALLSRCKICRRRHDSENMVRCDSCKLGHHLYCLKPKMKIIPSDPWFCDKCKKDQEPEIPTPPPRKRRIFQEEEIEEEEEKKEFEQEMDSSLENDDIVEEEEDEEDNDEISSDETSVCKTCGSGGELITCENCSNCYHTECVDPPLRHAPRGSWLCAVCKNYRDRKRQRDPSYVSSAVIQRSGKMNGQRRCAAQALYKIHDFAKSLRQLSDTDDSEEEVISKRTSRRDDNRSDLPLHNSALHAVLSEIMKDSNAWPFLRPVQKNEVPDYYDVITKPMDFGTIKYKLNMGEYHEDAQFMADALLVFQNCNTYNHTEDDVYKCGVELLQHFQRKCKELGLKLPEELDDDTRPKKKIRTK